MVFPKNQCKDQFLRVCAEAGITAYRGNPTSWLYRAAADDEQGYVKRLGRLFDTYLPLGSRNCYPMPVLSGDLPINLRGSRFLRPYSPMFRMFEPLRLHRIKRDLTEAARQGLILSPLVASAQFRGEYRDQPGVFAKDTGALSIAQRPLRNGKPQYG